MNDDLVLAVGRQFVEFVAQREGLIKEIQRLQALVQQQAEALKAAHGEERAKIVDGPEPFPGEKEN